MNASAEMYIKLRSYIISFIFRVDVSCFAVALECVHIHSPPFPRVPIFWFAAHEPLSCLALVVHCSFALDLEPSRQTTNFPDSGHAMSPKGVFVELHAREPNAEDPFVKQCAVLVGEVCTFGFSKFSTGVLDQSFCDCLRLEMWSVIDKCMRCFVHCFCVSLSCNISVFTQSAMPKQLQL